MKKIITLIFTLCIANQILAQSNSFPSTGDVIVASGNLKLSSGFTSGATYRVTSTNTYLYPGSNGFSVRKMDNSGDNLYISDAGAATFGSDVNMAGTATFGSDVIMASGNLKLSTGFSSGATYRVTSAHTYLYPGSNGFSVRKMDNSGDNLYISDAGTATFGSDVNMAGTATFGSDVNMAGTATFGSDVIMASGNLKLSNDFTSGATYRVTSANTYLYPGSNGFSVRKMDNSSDNFYISDAGAATFAGSITGGAGTFNGTVTAKKLTVTQYGWSDYVFAKGYKLRSLSSLESFIKRNKHLPEVPSAKEVEENGISVGDNQALLLKKIEELTLYLIQQQKEINKLKAKIRSDKRN
jgi:hypothetical protein